MVGQTSQPSTSITSLAEAMRNTQSVSQEENSDTSLNETLMQSAGQLGTENLSQARLLEEQKAEQEKRAIQLEQHNKINPAEQHDIFAAAEAKTTQELELWRHSLAQELAKKGSEDLELQKPLIDQITNTGTEGIGLKGYFGKLAIRIRDLIPQSEQQIFAGKKAKLDARQQTASVHDDIDNSERNIHRGGGQ